METGQYFSRSPISTYLKWRPWTRKGTDPLSLYVCNLINSIPWETRFGIDCGGMNNPLWLHPANNAGWDYTSESLRLSRGRLNKRGPKSLKNLINGGFEIIPSIDLINKKLYPTTFWNPNKNIHPKAKKTFSNEIRTCSKTKIDRFQRDKAWFTLQLKNRKLEN